MRGGRYSGMAGEVPLSALLFMKVRHHDPPHVIVKQLQIPDRHFGSFNITTQPLRLPRGTMYFSNTSLVVSCGVYPNTDFSFELESTGR